MPISPRIMKASALLLSGAALGGAGGYAASASGASASHSATHTKKAAHAAALEKRLRRAVSISAVVPAGNGSFATVTIERGSLLSSSGGSITLQEGTARSNYKTVTLSLPGDTVVRLSRQPSSLSALAAGDRVTVIAGPHRTAVLAHPKR
jgi:hypothetical protein